MKLIKGKNANYLTAKENIKNYKYETKDYFLQENKDNNFVVDLYIILDKGIEKVTSLSRETAEKATEKDLQKYLGKYKKVIKNENKDRL